MAKKVIANIAGVKITMTMLIVLLAIVFIGIPSYNSGSLNFGVPFAITGTGQNVSPQQQTPTVVTSCDSTTTPSVTFAVLDSIKNGTNLTASYDQNVYINGVAAANAAAGTAIAANPGDKLTIYFTNRSATHDVYGFIENYDVPCQEVVTVNTARGMQDGSLTTTVYDSDDITANTAAAPEALGVGATAEGRIRIKEATDDGYWSTTETGQKFLLTTDVNKTVFSDFEITQISPSASFVEVSTPPSHTSQDTTNNLLTVSFEVDGSQVTDLGLLDVYFRAPALSTFNPSNDVNLLFTIMDKELYLNTNTGQWTVDYYNAVNNADLGETNATDAYHIS